MTHHDVHSMKEDYFLNSFLLSSILIRYSHRAVWIYMLVVRPRYNASRLRLSRTIIRSNVGIIAMDFEA